MEVESFKPNSSSKKFGITQSAVNKIIGLKQVEQDQDIKFRVYITGGGCSGFTYGFMFDKTQSEDDIIIDKNSCDIVVDTMSYQYLQGAVLDYKSDLDGSKFRVSNPNATSTCSCGESFVV